MPCRPPTEIHRSKPCQAGHGVGSLQLPPVSQQNVENVVLGAGSQSSLVHAATHQLTVVNHNNCGRDKHKWKEATPLEPEWKHQQDQRV